MARRCPLRTKSSARVVDYVHEQLFNRQLQFRRLDR